MLCSIAVSGQCLLPTVPDLHRKNKYRHGKKWPDTLRSLPGQLALRERRRRSTYCCCRRPLLLDCCWTAAGTYVRADLYLYTFGLRTCADWTTLSYLAVSAWLRLAGRGGAGKEGPAWPFLTPPLAAARAESWLEGLLQCWLCWTCWRISGDPNNALLHRSLGCNVAYCA